MAKTATETTEAAPQPRLKVTYREELLQRLKQDLELGNVMQVPKPVKVVVNIGVGEATREAKALDGAVRDLTIITGQEPLVTKAK